MYQINIRVNQKHAQISFAGLSLTQDFVNLRIFALTQFIENNQTNQQSQPIVFVQAVWILVWLKVIKYFRLAQKLNQEGPNFRNHRELCLDSGWILLNVARKFPKIVLIQII